MALYVFIIFIFVTVLFFTVVPTSRKSEYFLIFSISLYWGFAYINSPDVPGYIDSYNSIEVGFNQSANLLNPSFSWYEKGFIIYMGWMKTFLGSNYYIFQFVTLLLELNLIFIGLKRFLDNRRETLLFFCFYSLQFAYYLIGAMRQGLVIALFTYSLPLVKKRQYLEVTCIYLFATLFHSSSFFLLIIIVFYWLLEDKIINLTQRKGLLLSIFILINCIYFLQINLQEYFSKALIYISTLSGSFSHAYDRFAENGFRESNFGFLKVVELDVIFIILFFLRTKQKFFIREKPLLIYSFLLFYLFNLLIGGIVVLRVSMFLQIPYNLVVVQSLTYLLRTKLKFSSLISNIIISIYYITFFIYTLIANPAYINEYYLFDF